MNFFTQSTSLMGTVKSIDSAALSFTLQTRSGDVFTVTVNTNVTFSVLKNIDGVNLDRFSSPAGYTGDTQSNITKYLQVDSLIALNCIAMLNGDKHQFDAREIYILQGEDKEFIFEQPHWWLRQIASFSDTWLHDIFGNEQTFDFSKYQTNIGITGMPEKSNTVQECATLSRLIYGLSSAYLMTGNDRYRKAAASGIEYQRENFRYITHDGKHVMWASAKDQGKLILASLNGDDVGAIPCYEQIYALAGLAQYYRITQNQEALDDIRMTVDMFNDFYYDKEYKGYFSHLDPATLTCDTDHLGDNKLKKNWNSIGDHIPAYLVNVLLALDPLPICDNQNKYVEMRDTLKAMLFECTDLIVTKFEDPDPSIPYVNERFHQDWTPDQEYRWQQDRAICGHNLKISWNLTRVANYYDTIGKDSKPLMSMAKRLADHLAVLGIDQIRGGVFDAVERQPKNDMWVDFAWMNTKDFWQQEQALLAYLVTYGYTKDENYLSLAREMSAFWNLYYLDHDNSGFFFRVSESGQPVIVGSNGDKGGHAISGYHAFELNYLAHIYSSNFVSQRSTCLHFKPENNGIRSINVLPDFMGPKSVIITGITINGLEKTIADPFNYQISLTDDELGGDIIIELTPMISQKPTPSNQEIEAYTQSLLQPISDNIPEYADTVGVNRKGKIAVVIENHFDFTELERFSQFYPEAGYQVEFVSHLWGQDAITFYSNPTDEGVVQSKISVTHEIENINPADYKAVILIGAYAMDRLRYQTEVFAGKENDAPALDFLRMSILTGNVKIGTICHSLWLYCADPSLLKDKKVTCASNIICDVENAGGLVQYIEEADGTRTVAEVFIDGNLITGRHPGVIDVFMQTLLEEIEAMEVATV